MGGEQKDQIAAAVRGTLPDKPGQRNNLLFKLARALKAILPLADEPANSPVLRELLKRWHGLALPFIDTKPFEDTWVEFMRAWENVLFPAGDDPLLAALARAHSGGVPTLATRYDHPKARLLASICRELQRHTGEEPFYLACPRLERLLEVDRKQAWLWLQLFQKDCPPLLHLVKRGTQGIGGKAARYRYIGGD
jgi:hypothetical protein